MSWRCAARVARESSLRLVTVWSLLLVGSASGAAGGDPLSALPADGWAHYDVDLQPGERAPCCYDWSATAGARATGYDLEGERASLQLDGGPADATAADINHHGERLRVYFKQERGQLSALQALSSACPVYGVAAMQPIADPGNPRSVQWLQQQVAAAAGRAIRQSAIMAIAHHAGAAATDALQSMSGSANSGQTRSDAVFWLGQARGEPGADILLDLIDSDAPIRLRRHAVFALSQSSAAKRGTSLRQLARSHHSDALRGEALFWLAQSDGAAATPELLAAIARETAPKVQKQAVFALSQIGPEADAALISLVRGDYPRWARREAMFWLGQSGSEQALAFFDQVIPAK